MTNVRKLFYVVSVLIFTIPALFSQSNRLTTEKGELLWQYNQHITIDENNPNTLLVTFVFINGMKQTAISLRQEFFYSQIEWLETANIQVGKEERVDFLTTNLVPGQSIVLKYALKTKLTDNKLIAEKSAILIMDEEFEIRKEMLPEQKFVLEKK